MGHDRALSPRLDRLRLADYLPNERLSSILCSSCRLFLKRSGTGENSGHPEIALVAGVFINGTLGLAHGNRATPGSNKCSGVIHREFVDEGVRINARKTLDDVQILCGISVGRFVREIGGVHNQRIALPMAPRIAEPLTHLGRQVWAPVQRDDALQQALKSDALVQALKSEAFTQALKSDALVQAMKSQATIQAMKSDALTQAMKSDAFTQALKSESFIQAMKSDALAQGMKSPN